jgi:hypothetical protein
MPGNEEEDYVTLEFETDDGDTEMVEYENMGIIEAGGREYMVLVQTEVEDAIEFYRYEEVGNDEYELTPIEDDGEFELVIAEMRKNGFDITIEN